MDRATQYTRPATSTIGRNGVMRQLAGPRNTSTASVPLTKITMQERLPLVLVLMIILIFTLQLYRWQYCVCFSLLGGSPYFFTMYWGGRTVRDSAAKYVAGTGWVL